MRHFLISFPFSRPSFTRRQCPLAHTNLQGTSLRRLTELTELQSSLEELGKILIRKNSNSFLQTGTAQLQGAERLAGGQVITRKRSAACSDYAVLAELGIVLADNELPIFGVCSQVAEHNRVAPQNDPVLDQRQVEIVVRHAARPEEQCGLVIVSKAVVTLQILEAHACPVVMQNVLLKAQRAHDRHNQSRLRAQVMLSRTCRVTTATVAKQSTIQGSNW